MKKIISAILLFSILISGIGVVATEEEALTCAYEADVLYALGIAEKTERSQDKAATRAELVAMAARLINAREYAQSGNVLFSDVPAGHIYYAGISAMAELGIISGYSDGTFCPDNAISYDEAVGVVMKALGYRVAAELKGGWSAGYRTVANQIGLTDGVSALESGELSRGDAIQLIYNALECPIFVPITFGANIRYEADENRTPLSEYHDIYKEEGYVNATVVSALTGYEPTDSSHIMVGESRYLVKKNAFVEYLGYYTEVYYRDDKTNEKEIVYMTPDDRLNQLVIKAEDVVKFSDLTYYYGDTNKKAVINKNHNLIVNGRRMTSYDDTAFQPENGEIILLSTEGRNYDTVIINTFKNYHLQRAAKGITSVITFTEKNSLRSFKVDLEKEDFRFLMEIDGENYEFNRFEFQTSTDNFFADSDFENTPETTHITYSFPVIPEGAVASVYADEYETVSGFTIPSREAKYVKISISTRFAEGRVESMNSDGDIVISGTEYKMAKTHVLNEGAQEFKTGVSGKFIMDCEDKIFAWMPDIYAEDGYEYAYLIKAAKSGGVFDGVVKARLLKKDGKIVELNFAQKLRFNGAVIQDADEVMLRLGQSAAMLDPTFKISQLIKYKMSAEGELSDVQTVLQPVGIPDGADPHQLNRDMERTRIAHEMNMLHVNGGTDEYPNPARLYSQNIHAVHFVVPPTETFEDDDYWIQDTWRVNFSQIGWRYDSWKTADVFDCDEFKAPNAVVIYEKLKDHEFVQNYVLVDEITTELSIKQTEITVLRGYDGWGSVAFYSDDPHMFDGIQRGDFVRLFGVGEKVARWEMVVSIDEVRNCDLSTMPKNLQEGIYEVYSKNIAKNLVLQRGPLGEDGKRSFQRASYYRGMGGSTSGAGTGPVYYRDGDNAVFSYFFSGTRSAFDDIRTVLDVGNEKATRVFVRDIPGMKTIVVYDLEEE